MIKSLKCYVLPFGLVLSAVLVARGAEIDPLVVSPRFELLNKQGRLVNQEEFAGRHMLITFGFTRCHHVCPVLAANMGKAIALSDADVVGIFVSVDTERDTVVITDNYAKTFGNAMLGLGGSRQQINAAIGNFLGTYAITKTEKSYTVQHTPYIYLIGPNSDFIDVFSLASTPAEIAAVIDGR